MKQRRMLFKPWVEKILSGAGNQELEEEANSLDDSEIRLLNKKAELAILQVKSVILVGSGAKQDQSKALSLFQKLAQ